MQKAPYIIATVAGIALGALLGAGFAAAPASVKASQTSNAGTVWTEYHAAIPDQPATESSPTF